MLLLQPLLLLVAAFAVTIFGYDEYGSYERVMFYYAYLTDIRTNGGTPKTFARNCSKGMGINGPCSYDQFIKYHTPGATGNIVITGEAYSEGNVPDLVETARLTREKGYTGTFDTKKFCNVKLTEYPSALKATVDKASGLFMKTGMPENLKTALTTSVQTVLRLRIAEAVESFEMTKDGRQVTIRTKTLPLWDGAPDTDDARGLTIDYPETLRSNPGVTKEEIKAAYANHVKGNHVENQRVLYKGLANMKNC
ncbi:hypothetical protein CGLO_13796 [Colletotrichum gloeosporioides Cg-14]|uniref:Uncharacterized protein n=1 Tax=Colletotrichum gloeosporioides (strain Cg-14) TaxID=1237896 RepID=T0JVQ2_COLGC|nr:hypothetical protein CGLO_13796 [Colletotrichum gloeosporioides Cg-14]